MFKLTAYHRMLLPITILLILLAFYGQVEADLHDHDHAHDEPAHYKYSREANEKTADFASHGHSHEQNHHSSKVGRTSAGYGAPFSSSTLYDPKGIFAFLNDYKTRLWVYSIGSTLLISFAPFVMLSLIPVQANRPDSEPMLKVLLSFGSGGLLGDAFLHLIPHSQPSHQDYSHEHASHGHSHGPHDMKVGLYVLAGILTFLTVEKFVRILRIRHIASHSHSHLASKVGRKSKSKKNKKSDISSSEESGHSHEERKSSVKGKGKSETGFKVAAYLNMVADFTHNFTDGLAIGASYLAGPTVGVVTMLTVLVHEVPHEIGDFAILVQSGFTKKKAMFVQLLTALGALAGCVLSLCASNASELSEAASSSWILPFTAGGFIYIATVSVIPELLENSSTWQSIKEVAALLTGILLMYFIAIYE